MDNNVRNFWKAVTKIILLSMTFISPVIVFANYHTGYYYGHAPPNGVSAYIRTWNYNFAEQHFYVNYICVYLSAGFNWWFSTGFCKDYRQNYQLKYFVEKSDRNGAPGPEWISSPTPVSGTYYTYFVEKMSGSNWKAYVIGKYSKTKSLNPYAAADYGALVETTTSSIRIDGSHFNYISAKPGTGDWYLWEDKYNVITPPDSPYGLTTPHTYEFYAYGGG
ncbi:hypothetical protein KEJ21_03960 [Candidatus Bathyarchaeota archaeon]|nr:hypothetical protein [Candidatus Bathyarchaeota archaeon]